MKGLTKSQKILLAVVLCIVGAAIVFFALAFLGATVFKQDFMSLLTQWQLYAIWGAVVVVGVAVVCLDVRMRGSRRVLKVNVDLENSHFMSKQEIAKNDGFTITKLSKLGEIEDGIPVSAEMVKDDISIILKKPSHCLTIGTTGSGKTSAFISPMLQILCRTKTKPSMVITDPKGELYTLHSAKLKEEGYKVSIIDLADVYHSTRWNPFNDVWRKTDKILNAKIEQRRGKYYLEDEEFLTEAEAEEKRKAQEAALKDEIFVDLQDLIYTMCPIENKNESSWEKGARDFILAIAVAFWEDVFDGYMPREKFNLYNIYRTISEYAKGDCDELRAYFATRSPSSKTHGLANTVLVAEDRTLSSYLTDVNQYMTWMADTGISALTSGNEIEFSDFDEMPNALFLKIPDEKENRHKLVTLFMTQMYKALVEKATLNKKQGKADTQELLRNVYFIMDEFGNMPRFHKIDSVVTVGRSRKIWLIPVIQDFNQLDDKYGKDVAGIIKSNCNIKVFIGTNDENTKREFSDLCGKKKVKQISYSENKDMSVSTSAQSVPLIYPNELDKLNDTGNGQFGNVIVSCMGNYPIRGKFTPMFLAKAVYATQKADVVPGKFVDFDEDSVYYDISKLTAYQERERMIFSGNALDEIVEQVQQVQQGGQDDTDISDEDLIEKRKLAIAMLADVQKKLQVLKSSLSQANFQQLDKVDIKTKLILLDEYADEATNLGNYILAAILDRCRNYILHRCFTAGEIDRVSHECVASIR